MALEKVLETELTKIDKEAGFKKDTIKYIINLIEDNYPIFFNFYKKDLIFNLIKSREEKITKKIQEKGYVQAKEDFINQELYNTTKNILHRLNKKAIRVFGVTIYRTKPESIDIKLGWAEYSKEKPHLKGLTEKGEKIINGYRKANGWNSIEDQQKIRDEFYENLKTK